jgi:hypothetical protein
VAVRSLKGLKKNYISIHSKNLPDIVKKADAEKYDIMVARQQRRVAEILTNPVKRAERNRKSREYSHRRRVEVPGFREIQNHRCVLSNAKRCQNAKAILLSVYGRVCACCGEDNPEFLTLDHIQNDGKEDRKAMGQNYKVYLKAAEENDRSRYQILCWNCNFGRARHGGVCPHKSETGEVKELGDGQVNGATS